MLEKMRRRFCGGLLEVYPDTLNMSNLFEAKIKVKGNIRSLSKLELGFHSFLQNKLISSMYFAFAGLCGDKEKSIENNNAIIVVHNNSLQRNKASHDKSQDYTLIENVARVVRVNDVFSKLKKKRSGFC